MIRLKRMTRLQAEQFNARSLPSVLWALSRLGVYHGKLYQRLLSQCLAVAPTLSAQGVAMTLYSIGLTTCSFTKLSSGADTAPSAIPPVATGDGAADATGDTSAVDAASDGCAEDANGDDVVVDATAAGDSRTLHAEPGVAEAEAECVVALLFRLRDVSGDLTLQGVANIAWALNAFWTTPHEAAHAAFPTLAAAAEACVARTRSTAGRRDGRPSGSSAGGGEKSTAKLAPKELAMWLYQAMIIPKDSAADTPWLNSHLQKLLPAAKAAIRVRHRGSDAVYAQTASTLLVAYGGEAGALIDTAFPATAAGGGVPGWLQGQPLSQTFVLRALAATRHSEPALCNGLLRQILANVRGGGVLAAHEPSVWLMPTAKLRLQLAKEEADFVRSFVRDALERKCFMNAGPPVVVQASAFPAATRLLCSIGFFSLSIFFQSHELSGATQCALLQCAAIF
jgi:hypothetical protein